MDKFGYVFKKKNNKHLHIIRLARTFDLQGNVMNITSGGNLNQKASSVSRMVS